MAKEEIKNSLHEPIAAIAGTRAKIAVLRLLLRANSPIPYREVARRASMAYRSIDLALRDLVAAGVVERTSWGRERLVRLRAGHRLAPAIANLFNAESDFFPALRAQLRAIGGQDGGDGLIAVAIVGAVATHDETLADTLDLVIVASTASAAARWRGRFAGAAGDTGARFGATLNPIAYDVQTARAMWRTRTPAAERLVREAESLIGPTLESVVSSDG